MTRGDHQKDNEKSKYSGGFFLLYSLLFLTYSAPYTHNTSTFYLEELLKCKAGPSQGAVPPFAC